MMNEFDYGVLTPYIKDVNITDINFNGRELWVDHLVKGRYRIKDFTDIHFMEQLCYKLANHTNLPFNASFPVVESETSQMRISIVHNSIARSGNSISIRKTPAIIRLNDEMLLQTKYANKAILNFLKLCVENHANVMVSGLPGSGKTELVKYLSNYILPHERVITIEDSLEIQYAVIHPSKDSVMMKVNEHFNYETAIKTCLRQRPNWILVSEVRSHEVVQLLQSVSTGAKLLSTIHSDKASSIPKRILHMFPGVELTNKTLLHMIHEVIDIGIHVESVVSTKGIQRYIKEICYFTVDEMSNMIVETIYHKDKKRALEIPLELKEKWKIKKKEDDKK